MEKTLQVQGFISVFYPAFHDRILVCGIVRHKVNHPFLKALGSESRPVFASFWNQILKKTFQNFESSTENSLHSKLLSKHNSA